MSNNKQTMKLYTELQVKQMIEKSRETGLTADYLIATSKGIELPSDEEIEEEILLNEYVDNDCDFRQGAEFVINKIQGGNK